MEENQSRISYLPTDGLTYDPSDSMYWDKTALDKEIERTMKKMQIFTPDSFTIYFHICEQRY